MINLTAAAAEKVKGILEQEKTNIPQGGLRISSAPSARSASSMAVLSLPPPKPQL